MIVLIISVILTSRNLFVYSHEYAIGADLSFLKSAEDKGFSFRQNMFFMAREYKKPIILVEVVYCSSPTEYKSKPAPFPETPEGQREFLDEVNKIIMNTPDNLGVGVFWWEPATMGGRSTRDYFDESGNVLPVITVFDKLTRK
jgi:arabinogalactan endo-1,4-beta-galactosidase